MTSDQASDELCDRILALVDTFTLDNDISIRDTAQIYREIASECQDRANGLEDEADHEDEA